MNNQDPIADMLTRIRNANRVGRRMVLVRNSKICRGIAGVLKEEGYIEDFDVIEDATRQGQIRIRLKYASYGDRASPAAGCTARWMNCPRCSTVSGSPW